MKTYKIILDLKSFVSFHWPGERKTHSGGKKEQKNQPINQNQPV